MMDEMEELISMEEREHLLNGLHRYLIWVGEKVPDEVDVQGENIRLHDIIWRCIHEKELLPEEKEHILNLVELLETKAKQDQEILLHEDLTRGEAKRLYNEIAGFIRAIMDLKECEQGNVRLKEPEKNEIRKKVDDAKRWIGFLKNVGTKISV